MVHAAEDLPPVLDVDVARVGQILANLVGNVLKYASDESPRSWRGRQSAAASGGVTVDDADPGIPEADRELWSLSRSTARGTCVSHVSRGRAWGCTSVGAWSRPTGES